MSGRLPHRPGPDTPYPVLIAQNNDNFEKVATDIADFGAKFSTVGPASLFLPATQTWRVTVTAHDSHPTYRLGQLQIVPRVDIYVDNDLDPDYLYGFGTGLSAGQKAIFPSLYAVRTVPVTGPSDTVAAFLFQLVNQDSVGHTYYVYLDESYIGSPARGQFR